MMVAASLTLEGFNDDRWGNNFHSNPHFFESVEYGKKQFNGRLEKFEHNMERLGRRMDNRSCNCPSSVTQQLESMSVSDQGNFIKF